MPPQPHVIGRQILDLEIEAERDAFALQAEIGEAFQTHVLPAMGALLDRWVDPEVVVRLDRLEIDVGHLEQEQLGETFAARVCATLETKLAASLTAGSQGADKPRGGDERWSKEEHALTLWHFLMEHGYLPWWAPPATAADIEARVEEVLASRDRLPDATANLLRTNPLAVRRLALQGTETLLKRVLHLVDRTLTAVGLPIMDAILGLLEKHSIASLRTEVFRGNLWEAALAESLQPKGRATDTQLLSLLRRAMQTTAGEASVTYVELLAHIRAFLEPSAASSGPPVSFEAHRTLAAILRALAESDDPSQDTLEQVKFGATHRRGRVKKLEAPDMQSGLVVDPDWRPQVRAPNREIAKTEDALASLSVGERDSSHSRGDSKPDAASETAPDALDATGASGVGPLRDRIGAASAGESPQTEDASGSWSALQQDDARLGTTGTPGTASETAPDVRDAPSASAAGPPNSGVGTPSTGDSPQRADAPASSSTLQQIDTRLGATGTTGAASETGLDARDATSASAVGPRCSGVGAASTGDSQQTADSPAPSSAFQQNETRLGAMGTPAASSESVPVGRDATTASGNRPLHSETEIAPAENHHAQTLVRGKHSETPPKHLRPLEPSRQPVPSTRIHEGEALYVDNAGIVLLHPFLQMHFEKLELVHEKGFLNESSRERAAHQLHFLATGEEEPQEYLLVLAKIICGLTPEAPIARTVPLDERAKSEADKVLKAVIRHWGTLKNTSPDGLRETFLRRQGRLERKDDGWRLRVESRSYDLLLDRLPWALSVVRLPWMPEPLFVEWG